MTLSAKWRWGRLADVLTPNKRPYTLGATEDADLIGVRWYGDGPFHRERKEALAIQKKDHFVMREGDVVYNKLFAWKGAFGVIPKALDGMHASDKFPTYALDRSRIAEDFLSWYFRVPALWEEAKIRSKGSAAISKLTLNPPDFLELPVPLPDMDVQQALAARLNEVRASVATAERIVADIERWLAAVVVAAVDEEVGRLAFDGTLAESLQGKPRNGWSPVCDNMDGGVAVLALGAVTGFAYRPDEVKRTSEATTPDAHYWLRAGDLLITRSNTPELVGHAAIYNGTPSPCIYPDLMMKVPVNEACASARFVHWLLQASSTRAFIRKNATGTSPTMKKISQGTVMNIPFPKSVSFEEQARIVDKLDRVRADCERALAAARTTRDLLRALLARAVVEAFGVAGRARILATD